MDPYTLAPGAFVASTPSVFPTGGALVGNLLNVPFSAGVLSGTLTSQVFAGDPSNPYGGLTFTYQFSIAASSTQGASQLSVSSFDSLLTDVSFNPGPGGNIAPSNFSRSSEGGGSGQVIRFSFFSPSVFANQTSDLLVVQTSGTAFNQTIAGIIDGATANVESYAPSPVPEPAAVALLLGGLGGLASCDAPGVSKSLLQKSTATLAEGRNPKAEIRKKAEIRRPKSEGRLQLGLVVGFRPSLKKLNLQVAMGWAFAKCRSMAFASLASQFLPSSARGAGMELSDFGFRRPAHCYNNL